MKILCIADLHMCDKETLSIIKEIEYDVLILLGDNPVDALQYIKKMNGNRRMFGVSGNHDEWETLDRNGIENIHGKVVTVNGITFAGMGGSHRYKEGNYAMLTHEESIEIAKHLSSAEILISHDCPYRVFSNNTAHKGLKGLSYYVRKHKPRVNLCGHYHFAKRKKYRRTVCQCVFGIQLFKHQNGKLYEENFCDKEQAL